jgi:hypothetical protein
LPTVSVASNSLLVLKDLNESNGARQSSAMAIELSLPEVDDKELIAKDCALRIHFA